MAITDLLVDTGPEIYYTKGFRDVLEDHMALLRNSPQTSVLVISPDECYQWRNDLFGLLQAKSIPMQFHWLMMRLNGYTSPMQFLPGTVGLLKPTFSSIEKILQSYNSISRIN